MKKLNQKILLVHDYPALHGGGVVQLNLDLAKSLIQKGSQVTIAVPEYNPDLKKLITESDQILVSLSSKFREMGKKSIRIARACGKPYKVWLHTKLPENYCDSEQGKEMQKVLSDKFCLSFICVSQSVADDMVANFGFSLKVAVVYPGVYMAQRFEADSLNLVLKSDVLFAGRLSTEKGGDIFIRAFSKLLKNSPNLKGVIIGDGEEKNSLVELAFNLGIKKSITFLPACSREELFKYIRNTRLFCVSSRTESFCITLAEALALGATVVAPNRGGPIEVLDSGRFGYLFKPEDPNDLARILKVALSENLSSKLLQKLYVMRRFNASVQFIQMAKLVISPNW